jgi:ABC-type bacteriocin/lantibiotic exporter with double-glycine peptidase domain
MAKRLPVPYYKQNEPGHCLAACAQMVLAFHGISRSQDDLAKQLSIKPSLGAPARNIQQLASNEIAVTYEEGSLEHLRAWLMSGLPVIAFVQAGELLHWRGEFFQHAVVVIGLEESTVWLLDPDMDATPIATPVDEFMLAWGEMDYLYAAMITNGEPPPITGY